MLCPDCNIELVQDTHERVPTHVCPNCSGIFMTQEHLARAVRDEIEPTSDEARAEAVRAAASPATATDTVPDAAPRACPACRTEMRRFVYAYSSGVLVDACNEHGIWLDTGELQRVEAWAEAERRGIYVNTTASLAETPESLQRSGEGLADATADMHASTVSIVSVLSGNPEGAAFARTVRAARDFVAPVAAAQRTATGSADAAMLARVRAEADEVPTEADGAIACRATVEVTGSTDDIWRAAVAPEYYADWMSGLEAADIALGQGTQRIQQVRWAGGHVVSQRVTKLVPDTEIVWRDEAEWLQGVQVPAWHAGSWTRVAITRTAPDRAILELAIVQLPADAASDQRIRERAPALQGWVDASVARLAAITTPH